MPAATTVGVDVAVLTLTAATLTSEALATSPSSSAVVAPPTVAVGRATPAANSPPVPRSWSAVAVFAEVAVVQ